MLVPDDSNVGKCTEIITKHLGERQKEWADMIYRTNPLRLIDLPYDVLQAILKEVTHTNDLSALALTHSALYDLVIPHVYSRFDIVWPDANPTVESRTGVDALTYGLATLVMAHDVFGESSHCQKCGQSNRCHHRLRSRKIRRGNHYAQYTRKFSLGNGPEDWVREYLITKEGGKMLGTLVALAVGRMRNLEAFIWDMPTGVLRDIWLALASLADREDGQPCRLERIWVRWHDNQDRVSLTPSNQPGTITATTDLPSLLTGTAASLFHIPPYPRVEYPTFSILPPLKSLSVLEIDELSYVEEMSVLIERSFGMLEELRVGLARHAQHDPWARSSEDKAILPPSLLYPGSSKVFPVPGGLLGILVGRSCPSICTSPVTNQPIGHLGEQTSMVMDLSPEAQSQDMSKSAISSVVGVDPQSLASDMNQLANLLSAQTIQESNETSRGESTETVSTPANSLSNITVLKRGSDMFDSDAAGGRSRKLGLHVLELERIYLSIPTLSHAFDWTKLRSLTLLGCRNHDQLWKAVRRKFTPLSKRRPSSISVVAAGHSGQTLSHSMAGSSTVVVPSSEYKLGITKLHTDTVSTSLLAFIKDTLAPDTLEWLFLQQTEIYKSVVTVEQIYRCAIRPHRASLRKLLIDSDIRTEDSATTTGWRRWAFSRELIACITSGRMQLRELGMSVDYKDWHYFLQRLPNAASLRSLHIAHIAEYVHGRVDSRETAQQILDVVALRPELQLCYVGVQAKCFEILESTDGRSFSPPPRSPPNMGMTPAHVEDDEVSDDDGDDADENDSVDLDIEINNNDDYDVSDGEATEKESRRPVFKLREILFYDDKISIFKARHGRL